MRLMEVTELTELTEVAIYSTVKSSIITDTGVSNLQGAEFILIKGTAHHEIQAQSKVFQLEKTALKVHIYKIWIVFVFKGA